MDTAVVGIRAAAGAVALRAQAAGVAHQQEVERRGRPQPVARQRVEQRAVGGVRAVLVRRRAVLRAWAGEKRGELGRADGLTEGMRGAEEAEEKVRGVPVEPGETAETREAAEAAANQTAVPRV